jgi:hypothetical protein
MGALIEIARSRFTEKKAPFMLPISSSSGPSMKLFDSTIVHADLTVIHGNNLTPEVKGAGTRKHFLDKLAPGPILMNEDNNGRATSAENLKKELASCDAVWDAGGSWGYMPWRQTQMFPFRYYDPSGDSHAGREVLPRRPGARQGQGLEIVLNPCQTGNCIIGLNAVAYQAMLPLPGCGASSSCSFTTSSPWSGRQRRELRPVVAGFPFGQEIQPTVSGPANDCGSLGPSAQ